jgi:hypothetical protein
MSQSAVAPHIHQSFDGHRGFPAQIPFDLEFPVDDVPYGGDFRIRKLIRLRVGTHTGISKDLYRLCPPDPVDIGKRDLHSFILG